MTVKKTFKQFLSESIEILMENRIEFIKNKYKGTDTSFDVTGQHKEVNDVVDHFAQHADPHPKKIYTDWIMGQHKKQNVRQEDAPAIHDALTSFDKNKGALEKKDINQYKSFADLKSVLPNEKEDAPTDLAFTKKVDEHVKNGEARVVHRSSDLTVVQPTTTKASCDLGKGTDWCTAAYDHEDSRNMFKHYHEKGPLYIIKDHKNDEIYQGHFESGQFMDKRDVPVRHEGHEGIVALAKKIPQITKVAEFKPSHPIFNSREENLKKLENINDQKESYIKAVIDTPEHLSLHPHELSMD